MIAALFFSCTNPCLSPYEEGSVETVSSGPLSLTRTAYSEGMCGPAFSATADLNEDGSSSLIVSLFGRSDGFALSNGSLISVDLETGEREILLSDEEGYKWPNSIEVADVDNDEDMDILVGFGFLTCQLNPFTGPCGALAWIENQGNEWKPHDIVRGENVFYHHPLFTDLDGDGIEDILTVKESYATPFGTEAGAELGWWKGLGDGAFSDEIYITDGLGSLPQLWDIDQDGDLDIISGEYFADPYTSYVWLEQKTPPSDDNPQGDWEKHTIDDNAGPTIQIHLVDDLYGDGVLRAVASNHTNTEKSSPDPWPSELAIYTPPEDPRQPWTKETIYDGFISATPSTQAAPGIFTVGDADDDGDMDILISGDGDPRVVWFEQSSSGIFELHTLEPELTQAGSLQIKNLSGDSRTEMTVSGYDDNVLFVYSKETE
ncbi:MAG: VCBS repeat-containing protein [Myxococcota bacterium]|nr:VCBS repeat-containing protein [Myxococcota bacterium]